MIKGDGEQLICPEKMKTFPEGGMRGLLHAMLHGEPVDRYICDCVRGPQEAPEDVSNVYVRIDRKIGSSTLSLCGKELIEAPDAPIDV